MKNVLLIGNLNTVFVSEFISEVLGRIPKIKLQVLNHSSYGKTNQSARQYCDDNGIQVDYAPDSEGKARRRLPHFEILWKNFLRLRLCRKQDIIIVLFVPDNAAAIALFSPKKARVIVGYFGSDLLRANSQRLLSHRFLLKRADVITVSTAYMRSSLSQAYSGHFDSKVSIARFGAKVIDCIKQLKQLPGSRAVFKREFGFPEEKVLMYVGYNGGKGQQHVPIIHELARLPAVVKNHLYLVCFCSYGIPGEAYLDEIEAAISSSGIAGRIITEYMKGERMAGFRMAADIMLNLQISDAFSASMQEHLEAGTVVVKGDWLKYPELEELGAEVVSIPNLTALPQKMSDLVANYNQYQAMARQNEGLVYRYLSWEKLRETWLGIIMK